MDVSSSEYRTEALKLILFAERTEWAAKHGTLGVKSKSSPGNKVCIGVANGGHQAVQSPGLDKDKLVPGELDQFPGVQEGDKNLIISDSSGSRVDRNRRESSEDKKHGKLFDKNIAAKSNAGFQDHPSVSSGEDHQDLIQPRYNITELRHMPTMQNSSRSNVNPARRDLIASAQKNANLVETLLGYPDAYSLPDPTLTQHAPTSQHMSSYSNTFAENSIPGRLVPGANYARDPPGSYMTERAGTSPYTYNVAPKQANNYSWVYQPSSADVAQCWLPNNNATHFDYSRDEMKFTAPTPVVRDRTLPDFKSSQVSKIEQSVGQSKHKQARIRCLGESKARRQGEKPRGKVNKKKPKALKRMDSIAKKYNL